MGSFKRIQAEVGIQWERKRQKHPSQVTDTNQKDPSHGGKRDKLKSIQAIVGGDAFEKHPSQRGEAESKRSKPERDTQFKIIQAKVGIQWERKRQKHPSQVTDTKQNDPSQRGESFQKDPS